MKISHWIAALLLLSLTNFPARFISPDALTAATNSVNAAFAVTVLKGPNIRAGQALVSGQPVEWLLSVTNPWTNNTVNMTISNPQQGMTLTPVSTTQANPSWKLSWIPNDSVIGALSVQMVTTFTQSNGASTHYNQPLVNVKVQGSGSQDASAAIKSIALTKAAWSSKTNTLNVSGRLVLAKGNNLPSGTVISIDYASGQPLPSSSALISSITPSGGWAAVIPLVPGTNPCTIKANAVIDGFETPAITTRKVTGKWAGCQ